MTSAVMAARAGLDPALLAKPAADAAPPQRVGRPDARTDAGALSGITRGAALLASLFSRQDAMIEAAKSAARTGGQGVAQEGNAEDTRKLYPPYPKEYEEQAKNLEKLVGVRRLNESLSFSASGSDNQDVPTVDVEKLKQAMQRALANSPNRGLTGQVNGIAHFLDS